MEKDDARKNVQSLLEKRKTIVKMKKAGFKKSKIAETCGVSRPMVDAVLSLYEKGGMNALKPKTRGRKDREKRLLSANQESEIQKLIRDKRPEQLKFKFALWTREAVAELVRSKFGVKLAKRTVGDYLKRWNFTPQKPIVRAYEQNPEAVKKWLEEEYPKIKADAVCENAEIHWADETAIVNTDVRGRSYAPCGQTPVVKAPGCRERFSMISAVNNRGKCHWMMIDGAFDATKLIDFMTALVKDVYADGKGKKVFLVMDNLRVHHSKPVKEWLEANTDKISVFYLPSYSPELNPDERLNADLKHEISSNAPARTREKLRSHAESHMKMVSNSPERVIKYFGDKHVSYAA